LGHGASSTPGIGKEGWSNGEQINQARPGVAGHKRQPHPAHGGSILYVDGTFYWYGETKEKSKADSGNWHWGVRCATNRWTKLSPLYPPHG
jgi:hypothetical protein